MEFSELCIEPGVNYAKQFRIIEQIGKGYTQQFLIIRSSYGAVYKALHEKSGTIVALKKQEIYGNLADIEAEINFMRQCNGPYVVNFYGMFKLLFAKSLGSSLEDNNMWVKFFFSAFSQTKKRS